MNPPTLFGHLAGRFVVQQENLATEALAYILGRSAPARAALIAVLNEVGAGLPPDLRFRTQAAGDDGAIPDLVGEDPEGRQVLLVEAKFWAGLTDAQPVRYLERLDAAGGRSLVFVAPALRARLLWGTLLGRCRERGIAVEEEDGRTGGSDVFAGTTPSGARLVLVSWRVILDAVLAALERSDDPGTAADVRQLQGLCDRMDAGSFLPLTSEELTGALPGRIVQYGQIADDVVTVLAQAGEVSTKGLRASAGNGWYGRYMSVGAAGCLLKFSAVRWAASAPTPLWLGVYGPGWKRNPALNDRLRQYGHDRHVTVEVAADGSVDLAITLPTGVERDVVVRSVLAQLRPALALVRESATAEQSGPAPLPDVLADPGGPAS